ncbi:MAG TPA: zinc ribbon domain-containing protein [Rhodomicrobium sp.]|nr:zinc ribbon domain-containing protein [Rhodomicrobium sp.]
MPLALAPFLKHFYSCFGTWGFEMPIYGYDCNACGHEFETLVRSSDTPACPSCGSADLTKQLSLIAQPAKGGNDTPPMSRGGGGCANCPGMLE